MTENEAHEILCALKRGDRSFTSEKVIAAYEVAVGHSTPAASDDPVHHPKHYTSHPSGIECIQVTEHMGFNIGNAVKYLWRADLKNDAVEDLRKAKWYIERELLKRGVK